MFYANMMLFVYMCSLCICSCIYIYMCIFVYVYDFVKLTQPRVTWEESLYEGLSTWDWPELIEAGKPNLNVVTPFYGLGPELYKSRKNELSVSRQAK